MAFNSDNKTPLDVNVVKEPDKEWWKGNIPGKDCLGQVSFVASIRIAFTLSASVTLVCSSSFHGRTDNTTTALLTSTSQIFTWAASTYGIALIASVTGVMIFFMKICIINSIIISLLIININSINI